MQVDKRGAVRQYSARQGHFFFFLEKKILSQVDKRGAVRQYPARQRHSGREGFVPRFGLLLLHIRVVHVSRLYFTAAVLKQAVKFSSAFVPSFGVGQTFKGLC